MNKVLQYDSNTMKIFTLYIKIFSMIKRFSLIGAVSFKLLQVDMIQSEDPLWSDFS